MRPSNVSLSAAGNSAWVPVDYVQAPFGVAIGCAISSGASLTYAVQHTFDDPFTSHTVAITQAVTTATVTDTAHGLSVGDSVTISNSGSTKLDGVWDVATIVNANSYTYTTTVTGSDVGGQFTQAIYMRTYTHATLTGQVARADGNYAFPIRACRLRNTTYVSGTSTMTVNQGISG